MTYLIFMLLVIIFIAFAQYLRQSDEEKVRLFIEQQGGTLVSISRNMGAEVFGSNNGTRYYDCSYRNQEQELINRQLRINFWQDINFVD